MWKGVLVVSRPLNGCTPIDPPPPLSPMFDLNITKSIALIRRYDCNFDLKVNNSGFLLLSSKNTAEHQWSNCFFRFCMHSKQDTALQSFTTCIQTFCSTWTTAMVHFLHSCTHCQDLHIKHIRFSHVLFFFTLQKLLQRKFSSHLCSPVTMLLRVLKMQ